MFWCWILFYFYSNKVINISQKLEQEKCLILFYKGGLKYGIEGDLYCTILILAPKEEGEPKKKVTESEI
jgi:hypothetical protein